MDEHISVRGMLEGVPLTAGHPRRPANVTKHGVSFDEATTAFADPLSSTFSDPGHSLAEERFVIFGVSHRGRLLAVMFTERRQLEAGDEVDVIRIISAREATRSERTAYEEGI